MEKGNKLAELYRSRAGQLLQKYSVFLVLIVLVCVAQVMSSAFLSYDNIMNILRQISTNAILSLGLLLVIMTGGMDISIGAVVGVSSVLMVTLFSPGDAVGPMAFLVHFFSRFVPVNISGLIVSSLVILLFGAVFGAFNGVVICRARIQPFIMTIGSMTLYRGLALLLTGGLLVYMGEEVVSLVDVIGKDRAILDIPNQLFILAVVSVVIAFLLNKTVFGRSLKAIGGNQESARLAGINVNFHKIAVYTICGLCAALAGILATARTTCGDPNLGDGYEMNAIAACVIGGAKLTGGRGTVIGTLCGALIIGIINNMMNLAGINTYWQYVVRGGIVILAVAFNSKEKSR